MLAPAFAAYRAPEAAAFAAGNLRCRRRAAEGALERTLADFDELLPQGLHTPDHHLLNDSGPCVGTLWWPGRSVPAALSRIRLHVAGDKPGAQALYRQLSFGVTGISMLKQLGTASS